MSQPVEVLQNQVRADDAHQSRLYRLTQKYTPFFFIAPAIIALLAVAIYPIIYSTGLSFFRINFARADRPFVGIDNFIAIVNDPTYRGAVLTTIVYVIFTVTGTFVMGFGTALLLRRITWGKNWLRVILFLPMTLAPAVVAMTWYWMLDPLFGLVNWILVGVGLPPQTWLAQTGTAFITVVFVDIWQWYPLVFLILDAGLSSLPKAPYEAARLEGASSWMVFRRITLPMMRPVILVALSLRLVDAFRTFDIVRIMTDGGPAKTTETVSLYLYRMAFTFNELSRAGAGSMLMLLMVGLISGWVFRRLYRDMATR